jgi:dephospho-CoA kinase
MTEMTSSKQPRKLWVIGLVGGIASGKSQVARCFAALGAAVIDADVIGHTVLQRPEVVNRLQERFGTEIVDSSGSINRRKLGSLVFGDDPAAAARLRQLEAVVHPLIRAESLRLLVGYRTSQQAPVAAVMDAPLLLEAGWDQLCDIILFVDTPEELCLQRAAQRGWDAAHFYARQAAQLSLEKKRQAATHFISGALEEAALRREVAALLRQLQ